MLLVFNVHTAWISKSYVLRVSPGVEPGPLWVMDGKMYRPRANVQIELKSVVEQHLAGRSRPRQPNRTQPSVCRHVSPLGTNLLGVDPAMYK